jgi:uncharacterized membrane protein
LDFASVGVDLVAVVGRAVADLLLFCGGIGVVLRHVRVDRAHLIERALALRA